MIDGRCQPLQSPLHVAGSREVIRVFIAQIGGNNKYIFPWIRMTCRLELLLRRSPDCTHAVALIDSISAQFLLTNLGMEAMRLKLKHFRLAAKFLFPQKES